MLWKLNTSESKLLFENEIKSKNYNRIRKKNFQGLEKILLLDYKFFFSLKETLENIEDKLSLIVLCKRPHGTLITRFILKEKALGQL